jgi:hypothetical protein
MKLNVQYLRECPDDVESAGYRWLAEDSRSPDKVIDRESA